MESNTALVSGSDHTWFHGPCTMHLYPDQANLLISVTWEAVIVSYNLETKRFTTIAGRGRRIAGNSLLPNPLNQPRGFCVAHQSGKIYIADSWHNCVQSCDLHNPDPLALSSVVGNGKVGVKSGQTTWNSLDHGYVGLPLSEVSLNCPYNLLLDSTEQRLIICCPFSFLIYEVNLKVGVVAKVWNMWDGHTGVDPIWAAFVDETESSMWVSTATALQIIEDGDSGYWQLTHVCGSLEGKRGYFDGPRLVARFNFINHAFVTHKIDGIVVLLCDTLNNKLRMYTQSNEMVSTIQTTDNAIDNPRCIIFLGDDMIVSSSGKRTIYRFSNYAAQEGFLLDSSPIQDPSTAMLRARSISINRLLVSLSDV